MKGLNGALGKIFSGIPSINVIVTLKLNVDEELHPV
jgi:hypothetical protein